MSPERFEIYLQIAAKVQVIRHCNDLIRDFREKPTQLPEYVQVLERLEAQKVQLESEIDELDLNLKRTP